MKAYFITYSNEEFETIAGIQQLKEFTQYRIDVEENNKKFKYKDYNNLTEKECLSILKNDGYDVKMFEIE